MWLHEQKSEHREGKFTRIIYFKVVHSKTLLILLKESPEAKAKVPFVSWRKRLKDAAGQLGAVLFWL